MVKGLIINPFTGEALIDNSFCPTGQGGGVDPTCGPSGSRSTGGKGGSVSKGQWVVHPQTGRRGVVSHTYDDNTNDKGRLIEVDYGNKKQNFRESELKKSKDQKSKWVDKTHEDSKKPQTQKEMQSALTRKSTYDSVTGKDSAPPRKPQSQKEMQAALTKKSAWKQGDYVESGDELATTKGKKERSNFEAAMEQGKKNAKKFDNKKTPEQSAKSTAGWLKSPEAKKAMAEKARSVRELQDSIREAQSMGNLAEVKDLKKKLSTLKGANLRGFVDPRDSSR